jgi:DHA1 family bicyclomycin/chloramphenicol resistance-like MFS transporter
MHSAEQDARSGFSARQIAFVVAAMSMLAPFSIDTYLPSFPDIASQFGASQLQMQQTLSLYLLAFAVTTLVYGPLADTFGRRRVVLGALGVYIVSSVACALAQDIEGLILSRIGQGLSASAGLVIGRAAVRDAFSGARAQQVMSRVMLLFSVAPAVAPIIGGALHDLSGWRSVFWFLAGLGAVVAALAYRCLPETLHPDHRQSIHPAAVTRVYWSALRHGRFLLVILVFALIFGGMFVYIAGAPALLYRHLGMGASQFVWLFAPMVSGIFAGAWLAGRLAGRLGTRQTVWAGLTLMAFASAANVVQGSLLPVQAVTVIGPMVIYAFGLSLSIPSLSLLALEYFPRNRGMASAVQSFVQTGANALVAGMLVPAVTHAVAAMAVATAALQAAGWILWLTWDRREPSSAMP